VPGTLLHLDSSADPSGSVSRRLTDRFARAWLAAAPGRRVVRRDLHTDQLPHLASSAQHWAPGLRAPGETAPAEADALQRLLIDELLGADVLLVGAPMYNWSVPSTLKTWIDHVHVPGLTVGIAPLPLAGRPVVLVSARGGSYTDGAPGALPDPQLPGLRILFGTALGMDLHPVLAELTLASRLPALADRIPDAAASLAAAEREIDRLAATLG
jgi:FMN-dependent NADH-azoreductase